MVARGRELELPKFGPLVSSCEVCHKVSFYAPATSGERGVTNRKTKRPFKEARARTTPMAKQGAHGSQLDGPRSSMATEGSSGSYMTGTKEPRPARDDEPFHS